MSNSTTTVAVIGGGVVGAAMLFTLTQQGVDAVLLESDSGLAYAASGTNSGVLHTGFDSTPGQLETDLILRAAQLRPPVLEALQVPVLRCGAVLQPHQPEDHDVIARLAQAAGVNGVEVHLRQEDGALLVPGESVTDPVAFTQALVEAAVALGARLELNARVGGIDRTTTGLTLHLVDGRRVECAVAINCAGLHADDVARLAGDDSFEIYPRKGEFFVFELPDGQRLNHIVLPVPTQRTKGVLVFPTLDGKVVAGPTAVDLHDKNDWSVRPEAQDEILTKAYQQFPPLEGLSPIDSYAGLRPAGRDANYIVGPSSAEPALINVAAIRSTGLTASLGIASYVSEMLPDLGVTTTRMPQPVAAPTERAAASTQQWWQRTAHRHRAAQNDKSEYQLHGGPIESPSCRAVQADRVGTTGPAVTVENWQDPAVLGWSYQHVDEILPTAPISAGPGSGVVLPRAVIDLEHLELSVADGGCSVGDILARSETDGWMVLHDGRVVAEQYFGQMTAGTAHLLQSVSKSLVATVVGALVGQGLIDPAAPVTAYVPELATTGYAGATVRQLLDMRSGIAFVEDYFSPCSDSRLLEAASGWAPVPEGAPRSIKQFLLGLRQARPHGGPCEYRSCETAVLGWVCQAAANTWFPRLASDLVWSRLGAQYDATITVDSEGTGAFDGGISATVGDLARFGLMILGSGRSVAGEQVVPSDWVHDIFTGAPDSAEAFAASPDDRSMPGGRYRSQFWLPFADRDVAVCLGIHGQLVYLDRAAGVVGVKVSSWPAPEDSWKSAATLRMFAAVSSHLMTLS